VVPTIYRPATVDAIELGTKNTLLDDTVTANLDIWYYNYENYQVGIIANRQALTLDIPARLFGFEGEFLWQPADSGLAFNATVSLTGSQTGHVFVADQHNPTVNVPGAIWIKDVDNGSNCVVLPTASGSHAAAAAGTTPGDSAANHVQGFYLPNGGDATIDAQYGIPLVNYGVCGGEGSFIQKQLQLQGYDYAPAINPRNGQVVTFTDGSGTHVLHDGTGIARDLHGNRLPQIPTGQLGVGAQYTWQIGDGYTVVPRVDYYFQTSMQARIWNDPVIDRINSWDVMNLQIQLNEPDSKWFVQGFTKNLFDKHNPTGVYLTDATSALFTNVFSEDPRTFGLQVGASW
jgi:iron complex outermembrane receptor protein